MLEWTTLALKEQLERDMFVWAEMRKKTKDHFYTFGKYVAEACS